LPYYEQEFRQNKKYRRPQNQLIETTLVSEHATCFGTTKQYPFIRNTERKVCLIMKIMVSVYNT
jgi:hypothetical protein